MRARTLAYEHEHDLVPGTASWDGWTITDLGAPTGGVPWEDRARMAHARKTEDRDDGDLAAIARFPRPRSGVG